MTVSSYRATGDAMSVRFAFGECSLGVLLVAATVKGVCSILLGDTRAELTRELENWVPKGNIPEPDSSMDRLVGAGALLVDNPASDYKLPLDLYGTKFQLRVWRILRNISPGTTMTYTDIAMRLGTPGAVRSVWHAVNCNPLAVAIPCHRVVHANGKLGGCRWGLARQTELLAREKARRDC